MCVSARDCGEGVGGVHRVGDVERRIGIAVAVEVIVAVKAGGRAVTGPVAEVVQRPAEVAFERPAAGRGAGTL